MEEITIKVSDKLFKFLNRYYPHDMPIDAKFYLALSEGHIVSKGKSFCLSFQMNHIENEIIDRERNEERLSFGTDFADL